MITINEEVLILTLRIDEGSQQFFDELRQRHFPAERNYLKAHLTLFHKLPDIKETMNYLDQVSASKFNLDVSGLINLGAGVAYRLESEELNTLRARLAVLFKDILSPQDRQGFRAHITIQNKTTPQIAKILLADLSQNFQPFTVQATGLDLWSYLGGPWAHKQFFPFKA